MTKEEKLLLRRKLTNFTILQLVSFVAFYILYRLTGFEFTVISLLSALLVTNLPDFPTIDN